MDVALAFSASFITRELRKEAAVRPLVLLVLLKSISQRGMLSLVAAALENESTTSDIVATVAGKTTPDALVSISGEPVHVDVLG
jgi:hypothetical protein